jgi:hypothetical protein
MRIFYANGCKRPSYVSAAWHAKRIGLSSQDDEDADDDTTPERDGLQAERMSEHGRSRWPLILMSVLLVLALAVWVFDRFFLDDIITTVAAKKLTEGVRTGSGGMFAIKVKHFVYRDGVAEGHGVDIERTGYHADETGTILGRVTADSVRIRGINWLDVVLKRPISATSVSIWQPTIYLADAKRERAGAKILSNDSSSASTRFSLDSAVLINARMLPPGVSTRDEGDISFASFVRVVGLDYNSAEHGAQKFKTKDISFDIPRFAYPAGSAWLHFQHALGDTRDSAITIDSFSYRPSGYSKKRAGSTNAIAAAGLSVSGLDCGKLISGSSLTMHSLSAKSWNVESNSNGASKSTGPMKLSSQAEIVKSLKFPVSVAAVVLAGGSVRMLKRARPIFYTKKITLKATNLRLSSHSTRDTRPLFCDDVTIETPMFEQPNASDGELALSGLYASTRARRINVEHVHYSANGSQIDSHQLHIANIDFQKLCAGKEISIGAVNTADWRVHWERMGGNLETTAPKKKSDNALKDRIGFPISIASISLPNGAIVIHKDRTFQDTTSTTWKFQDGERVNASGIAFDPRKNDALHVKTLTAHLPSVHYDGSSAWYSFDLWNIDARVQDSLITIDSVTYIPKFSKEDWAARNPYARYRLDFRTQKVIGSGIDFAGLAGGRECTVQKLAVGQWSLDAYKDERPPKNPHPDSVHMPNDFIAKTQFPLTILTTDLAPGNVLIKTIPSNGAGPATITFDSVWMRSTVVTLDSNSSHAQDSTRFVVGGILIKQSLLHVTATYPMKDTGFDLSLIGHVGPFDAQRLNDYLVPEVREEIRKGHLDSGLIAMTVTHGVSQTMVTPVYHDLHVKVLPKDPKDKADLKEDIETLIANEFIVHDDNPDHPSQQPRSETMPLTRKPTDAFFQFIWASIKQPLGKIVGGIK